MRRSVVHTAPESAICSDGEGTGAVPQMAVPILDAQMIDRVTAVVGQAGVAEAMPSQLALLQNAAPSPIPGGCVGRMEPLRTSVLVLRRGPGGRLPERR